jgi:hypothetical protein
MPEGIHLSMFNLVLGRCPGVPYDSWLVAFGHGRRVFWHSPFDANILKALRRFKSSGQR